MSEQAGISAGYLSRLESGLVADGPSAQCLEALAAALEVDFLGLLRLKGAESNPPQTFEPEEKTENRNVSELEARFLDTLSELDPKGQYLVLEILDDVRKLFPRLRVQPLPPELPLEKVHTRRKVKDLFVELAQTYRRLGEELLHEGDPGEASVSYGAALTLLEKLSPDEFRTEIPEIRYNLARVEHFLGNQSLTDTDLSLAERVHHFHYASSHCAIAWEQLKKVDSDAASELRPAILAQWAASATPLGRLFKSERTDTPLMFSHHLHEAEILRERAAEEYEALIARLKAESSPESRYSLALAYHRAGILARARMDDRKAMGTQPTPAEYRASINYLMEAVDLRRGLCIQGGLRDPDYLLRGLSLSHQELGLTFCSAAGTDVFPQAMWQFKVSDFLSTLKNNNRIKQIRDQLETKARSEVRVAVTRRIAQLLEGVDKRALKYDILIESLGSEYDEPR